MTEQEIISIVLDICIYKGDNDGLSKKDYQAIQGLVDLYNKEKEKSQKQDTEINKLNNVIDRMAESLINYEIDEDICSKRKNSESEEDDCYLDVYYGSEVCKNCVKEYFMKEDKDE